MNLIEIDRLTTWLDAEGLEAGAELSIEPLSGGSSNLMFCLDRGERRWVLRRPTAVAVDRADEGMRREFRLLRALERTDVPHPAPVALCDDHAVLGCTFYVMGRLEGVPPFPVPPGLDNHAGRAELSFSMVDGLAHLHQVDWRGAGLADLGRPEGFHERQVSRWGGQLASYDGRSLPGIDSVMPWLELNRPETFDPTIMHGDYHMLNVLVDTGRPGRVIGILDWETATIGDPLLDLAGFCEIWCSVATDGWPSRQDLIERYCAVRRLGGLPDLTYYDVLYNFRLAVLLEGIYQRSLRDPNRPDQHAIGERVLFNVSRAVELVSGTA
jgi:aminoglycoside phosphotransferase (APT) family kinase protein